MFWTFSLFSIPGDLIAMYPVSNYLSLSPSLRRYSSRKCIVPNIDRWQLEIHRFFTKFRFEIIFHLIYLSPHFWNYLQDVPKFWSPRSFIFWCKLAFFCFLYLFFWLSLLLLLCLVFSCVFTVFQCLFAPFFVCMSTLI